MKGAAKRALFLNFSEKPVNIIRVMDDARQQQGEFVKSFRKRLRILALLLPAGLPFLLLDWILGNNFLTFSLVAYVLWGAALVGLIVLQRNWPVRREKRPSPPAGAIISRLFLGLFLSIWALVFLLGMGVGAFALAHPVLVIALVLAAGTQYGVVRLWRSRPSDSSEEFGPNFEAARTVFETLKDDLAPKRTLLGWLDLTGAQQPGKVVRERTSASGSPVKYYRDEWLRIKMPLYDGNVLRVLGVERVKAKLGRWKRSVSGKTKWKPGGTPQVRNELRVAVAVDPQAYQILPVQSGQVGKFQVEASRDGGSDSRLVLKASSGLDIDGWDILRLLRFAYDHVKPRGGATT